MPALLGAAIFIFVEGTVLWATFPIATFYLRELGVSEGAIGLWLGLTFALQTLPRVVMNSVLGRWSDRVGRRTTLIVAGLGTCSASVLWALAPNALWLVISRAVAGTFGAHAVLATAIVSDTTPPQRRTAAMGVLGVGFATSMVLGPLFGGAMSSLGGHAMVGWGLAVLQVISLLIIVTTLPETRPVAGETDAPRARLPLRRLLRRPRVRWLLTATLLMTGSAAVFTTTFAELMARRYGLGAQTVSLAFTFFGCIGIAVQGGLLRMLLRQYTPRAIAMLGLVALATGHGLVAWPAPQGVLWVGAVLIGIGGALCMPTLTSLVSECVAPQHQGTMMGTHQSAISLGRAAGSMLCGGLLTLGGLVTAYGTAAAIALVGFALLWRLRAAPAEAEEPLGVATQDGPADVV